MVRGGGGGVESRALGALLVTALVVLCTGTLARKATRASIEQGGGENLVFTFPSLPCTDELASNQNQVVFGDQTGPLATTIEAGSRIVTLAGASNHIGNDQHPIVNAVLIGSQGTQTHSNSVLLAFANRAAASRRNNEFRLQAANGAAFEATELRAAGVLFRDDPTQRSNVSTLTQYLASQATTATELVGNLTGYRYHWASNYSAETRFRYGLLPSEAASVDTAVAPPVHTIANETFSAAVINDTAEGVCQKENSGLLEIVGDSSEGASVDLVSLVTLLAEAIRELDARITALEP